MAVSGRVDPREVARELAPRRKAKHLGVTELFPLRQFRAKLFLRFAAERRKRPALRGVVGLFGERIDRTRRGPTRRRCRHHERDDEDESARFASSVAWPSRPCFFTTTWARRPCYCKDALTPRQVPSPPREHRSRRSSQSPACAASSPAAPSASRPPGRSGRTARSSAGP